MQKAGIVQEIDNINHTARVIFPELDNLVSGWLQVVVPFSKAGKSNPMPIEGEQVLCLMDENLEDGYILGTLYSEEEQTPLADENIFVHEFDDGTKIQYNKETHILTADAAGVVSITAVTGISLAAPVINITGNITHEGTQTTTGTIIAADNISDGISGKTHTHGGVYPGGGTTGVPQ